MKDTNMDQEFLPYNLAKLAQEKGFKKECFAYFDWDCKHLNYDFTGYGDTVMSVKAPLYQQIVDWFETKGIIVDANYFTEGSYRGYCHKKGLFGMLAQKQFANNKTKVEAYNKAIEEAFNLLDSE